MRKIDVLATARCGCRVQRPIGTTTIQLAVCPLHEAAADVVDALERLVYSADHAIYLGEALNAARAAIARARSAPNATGDADSNPSPR